MNTEALLRNTVHPPCIEEQETFAVTVPADRSALSFADRMSLRVGLWLLLRTERQRATRGDLTREEARRLLQKRDVSEREAFAMLTYHAQRVLR